MTSVLLPKQGHAPAMQNRQTIGLECVGVQSEVWVSSQMTSGTITEKNVQPAAIEGNGDSFSAYLERSPLALQTDMGTAFCFLSVGNLSYVRKSFRRKSSTLIPFLYRRGN